MKQFRNTYIFRDDLNETISYLEKSNKNPTVIFGKLLDIKQRDMISKLKYLEYQNILKRLLNICTYDTFVYIFSEIDSLQKDILEMSNTGFKLRNILSYKIEYKYDKFFKLYQKQLKYVLFFTSHSIKEKDRKLSKRSQTNLINNSNPVKVKDKDYSKEIVKELIETSLMKSIDENIVLDIHSESGNIAEYCLRNNLECYSNSLNYKGNVVKLSKILEYLNNYKKDEIKDYSDRNKKISENMRKNSLKRKIKNIAENK